MTFITPLKGLMNVSITGKQSLISNLQPTDIQVSIDVTDMGEGEHSAPILIKTPDNTEAQSSVSVAKVTIVKKENAT